jgi:hypothetical protein
MKLTVTQIVKRWNGKRQKKTSKYDATTYVFKSQFTAQQAFFDIREHQPKKELNQFDNKIIVQPW